MHAYFIGHLASSMRTACGGCQWRVFVLLKFWRALPRSPRFESARHFHTQTKHSMSNGVCVLVCRCSRNIKNAQEIETVLKTHNERCVAGSVPPVRNEREGCHGKRLRSSARNGVRHIVANLTSSSGLRFVPISSTNFQSLNNLRPTTANNL